MDASNSSIRYNDEPTMSDKTLVLNVEDFIALSFGPLETNSVNFSMMQIVLNTLCRHMRFLEKTVEIRFKEDEERIQAMMQQLLEEESEDSSEFKEDIKKRKRYVKESKSDDTLTSDEIEDFVERKAKKSKDKVKKSHLKDEVDDDSSTEAEDDQKIKDNEGKAKAKAISKKMDDDIDSIRSKDKSGKKHMPADDGKKVDKDERYGMRETADDFTTLHKAKDTTNKIDKKSNDTESKIDIKPKDVTRKEIKIAEDTDQKIHKEKKGNKEGSSRKTEAAVEPYSSDVSEDTEQEVEKRSKGIKSVKSKKAAKVDGSPKSQTTDRSDVNEKNVKTPKDKIEFKSQKRQASEDLVLSGRSDNVSETYVKKGKDTLKIQLKTKKADDDADTVSDTKKSKGRKKKMGKKEAKPKRSEIADDATPEIDETEYSGKRKGEKRKDKKIPEVQEARSKKGKAAADTHTKFGGISVTEVVRKGGKGPKDTILVVEKGPTTRDSYPRLGNIEVVTRSQFELIESDVKALMEQSGPMPIPFMADNKQLKRDLAKGSATLPGAMETMHLNARVKAVEEALSRMAILLTQVASDGTLPPETADMIKQLQDEQRELSRLMSAEGLSTKQKTSETAIAPAATTPKTVMTEMYPPVRLGRPDSAMKRMGQQRQKSIGSTAATMDTSYLIPPENPLLTQSDLSQALDNMKHEMMKRITEITAKSTAAAVQVHNLAKAAVDKLAISLALNNRIQTLNEFTTEQGDLLTGFDTDLSCQLLAFQEKLNSMRTAHKDGLKQLDRGDRLESLAVTALRGHHNTIRFMMDETVHHHEKLLITHGRMNDALRSMLDWVDLIRTEKADRVDVAKGLEEKANINALQGLLFEDAFEVSGRELNEQLERCYNEFGIINSGWMETLAELKAASQQKADFMHLYSLKDFATNDLKKFMACLERLEDLLGEPQLALLTHLLSRGAYCGSCLVAAQIVPFDKNYQKPPPMPPLPMLLGVLPKVEEPANILRPPDNRKQIIKRWVGGSHTLIKNPKNPEKLPQSQLQSTPTKHYGASEYMYMEEEVLQACVECNQVLKDKTEDKPPQESPSGEVGAGDQDPDQTGDQDPDQTGDQGPDQTGDQGPANKDSDFHKIASTVSIAGSSSRVK